MFKVPVFYAIIGKLNLPFPRETKGFTAEIPLASALLLLSEH